MGHKGDIEARYTTNKGRLPDELLRDMRRAFRESEPFLSTATEVQEQDRKQLLLEMWREQAKLYGIDPMKIKIEKQREDGGSLAFNLRCLEIHVLTYSGSLICRVRCAV